MVSGVWKWCLALLAGVLVGVSLLPVQQAASAPFASVAFEQLWSLQHEGELDPWGSTPLAWRIEPYADAAGGRRLVQYFDRGRMELQTRPGSGLQEVTQGLLVWEMTTGQVALGDTLTVPLAPPVRAIDGGELDPQVPTYAGLSRVVLQPAPDLSQRGVPVDAWIDANGQVAVADPPVTVQLAQYVAATGHNLPRVTVDFFARQPFGEASWVDVLGYPISEPYWSFYRHDGTALPSLVQVFQRRILVYTPTLPPQQRFTIPNSGRHYYRWRYGAEATQLWPDIRPGRPAQQVVAAPGFQVGIYVSEIEPPIGLAISPEGKLLVLTSSGSVLEVQREDATGSASELTTFASGLVNPRGMAVYGGWVYVSDDRGVWRVKDADGDGIAEQAELVTADVSPLPGPAGAPVVDDRGRLFVAGVLQGTILLDATSERARVYQVETSGAVPVDVGIDQPALLVSWGQLLLAMEHRPGVPAQFVRVESGTSTRALAAEPVVTVPEGVAVNAALVYTSQLWPRLVPGTLLIAAIDGSRGVLLQALPGNGGAGSPEMTELVAGLSDPAALAVGLDGAVYVADAVMRQVVKVTPLGEDSP